MHIPDGFLDAEVAAAAAVAAAGAVAYGLRRADRTLDERAVPLLGVTGAFVFAAQMLNFPVAGGTSGHFLGAALAAALLGPWIACVVLAVVLGHAGVRLRRRRHHRPRSQRAEHGRHRRSGRRGGARGRRRVLPGTRAAFLGLVGIAAWLAVMAGAAATAVQLAASGTVPLGTVMPAMLGVHALIGVGEAVVTVAAVSAVLASRPDLVAGSAARAAGGPQRRRGGLGVDLGAPVHRPRPRRRHRAGDRSLAVGVVEPRRAREGRPGAGLPAGRAPRRAQEEAPAPGYAFPGVEDERLATGLAGFTGTLLVFAVGYGLARVVVRRPPRAEPLP